MKRWRIERGRKDIVGLVLDEVVMPGPASDQVRVKVCAASLNYRDHLVLALPEQLRTSNEIIPLADGAGEIDAVGDGVTGWAVGDRVVTLYFRDWPSGPPRLDMGMGLGSADEDGVLAEYVILPSNRITSAPSSLSHIEAATLPCAGLTAWSALMGDHRLRAGAKVLVLGTGGVSLFALQIASKLGAITYATTSRDGNRERLAELGVTRVFDYKLDSSWGRTVYGATGGMDKVVNAAGPGSLNQCLQALAPGGEVATLGLMSLDSAPLDVATLMAKGLNVRGITVGNAEQFAELARFIDDSRLKPIIHRTVPFLQAREAYSAHLAPDLFGKIVIDTTDLTQPS